MDKRSRLIRLVQVGRRALALEDECYRDLLASHTGKRSAALLSEQELEQVLTAFKTAGFIPKPARHTANKRLSPTAGSHIRVNEIAKIRAIWCEMARLGIVRDGSETALNHWVQRMTARLNGGVGVAAGVASEFGKNPTLSQWSGGLSHKCSGLIIPDTILGGTVATMT